MSKTYKDSRRGDHRVTRKELNTRKRFVQNKEQKRQNKFKQFVPYDEGDILLVHGGNYDYYDDWKYSV